MNTKSIPALLLASALVAGLLSGCTHQSAASSGNALAATPSQSPATPVVAEPPPAAEDKGATPAVPAPAPTGHDAPALRETTETPQRPKGQRPPADRAPRRPGEAEKITFDDLNLGMQADMVYRPFLINDRVKELEGQRVSILGFMHPGATGKGIKQFILLKNTECKFGKGGQADHLAEVHLAEGQSTAFGIEAFKVEGTLKVEPYEGADGNTWSIYVLEDAKIVR